MKIVKYDVSQIIKYVFYIILLLIGVALFSKVLCQKDQPIPDITDVTEALQDAGFVKPGNNPGVKPDSISGVTPIISGGGIVTNPDGPWPDTLSVEIGVVTDPAGHPWIGTWIEGHPVHWVEYPQIDWPVVNNKPSSWVGTIEATLVEEELDWGIGLAWTPLHFWGVNAGLVSTVDMSLFHGDVEWGAAGLYVDKKMSIFRVGASVGYQFGRSEGVRAGINVGIGLDF